MLLVTAGNVGNVVEVIFTKVVFAPALGTFPLTLPSDGVLGEVAYNKRYPPLFAPLPGKEALFQLTVIWPLPGTVDKVVGWAVTGLLRVLKLPSELMLVPMLLVA